MYTTSFAVYLDENSNTYVEPDIRVICDKGCKGAPDWTIEIVSVGVREYWIVDPGIFFYLEI